MLDIRPAIIDDIPLLSEYWYDNMALLQQSNPRIRLAPDARLRWERSARRLLQRSDAIVLTAAAANEVIGCIAGRVVANQPGLVPETIGCVEWLIIDLHNPHKQQGTGTSLLRALRAKFTERGIAQMEARVTAYSAVAQAFWQGVGTTKTDDIFWMAL